MKFHVVVRRTELITYEVEADNEAEADNLALREGEEVSSELVESETVETYSFVEDE